MLHIIAPPLFRKLQELRPLYDLNATGAQLRGQKLH